MTSCPSLCRILAAASISTGAVLAQSTVCVSTTTAGVPGNSFSDTPRISADGRYVLFASAASNLVASDTNDATDTFLRDLQTGTTTRIGDELYGVTMSDDARFLGYASAELVPAPANGFVQSCVLERATGHVTVVSVSSFGDRAKGLSYPPVFSADGLTVAFMSEATNLVPGDTNSSVDVFVHDLASLTTTRVSVSSSGAQVLEDSYAPSLSGDGRFVAFHSKAGDLVPNDAAPDWDVFVHDRQTGQTTCVSVRPDGLPGGEIAFGSTGPQISADGRFIAFTSQAFDLVPGDGVDGYQDVFVRDRVLGQTTRASIDSNGAAANDVSYAASISPDGRFVGFCSAASNLVLGDTNERFDAFVHDRTTGQTTRASVDGAGVQANGNTTGLSVSANGRYVAFTCLASNLVAGDANAAYDVFLRDRGAGPIVSFCAGDGSVAACPCVNYGAPLHGCANSIHSAGGWLRGLGAPSLSGDSLVLAAQDLSGNTCVFFQGTLQTAATPIDDGLGCVGGALIRIGTKPVASSASTYPQAGDFDVSIKGAVPALGATRYYQAMYRNAEPFCTSATTNRTNGLIVVWTP